jgi:hypothetical protein
VKPEDGLDGHVNQCAQVIAPINVAQLVREYRLKLPPRQMLGNSYWEHQNGPQQTNYSGFNHPLRQTNFDWRRNVGGNA